LNVPPNCPVGATLQVAGHGNQEDKNYPPGNLNVTLGLEQTKNVQDITKDGNVHVVSEITLDQWYNDENIQIDRFGAENLSYDLSNLKNSHKQYRFSGKGLRNAQNNGQGDLIVSFRITK